MRPGKPDRILAWLCALALHLAGAWAQAQGVLVDSITLDDDGTGGSAAAPRPGTRGGGFAPPESGRVSGTAGDRRVPIDEVERGAAPGSGFSAPSTAPRRTAPGAPLPNLLVPRVLAMYPNELVQGKSYSLSLSGEHLGTNLKLDFGPGILVKGVPQTSYGGKLRVDIEVLPFAATGQRRLKLATPFGTPAEQPVEFRILQQTLQPSSAPVVKVQLPAFDPVKIAKGRILLDAPDWRKQVDSQMPPKDLVTGKPQGQPTPIYQNQTPTLDDSLLFIWHEQNKGLAERFEIRFFKGDRLLAKRDLPVPTGSSWAAIPHYRPDAELIAELFQAIAADNLKKMGAGAQGGQSQAKPASAGFKGPSALAKSGAPGPAGSKTLDALAQAVQAADIAWEVAGFRRYARNGVAKHALAELAEAPIQLAAGFAPKPKTLSDVGAALSPPSTAAVQELVDVEVEISERRPLNLPAAPTGLGCPSALSAGLTLHNLDSTTQQGKLAGASGYAYDRFQLKGQFDLGASPYAAPVAKGQTSTPETQTKLSLPFGGGTSLGSPAKVLTTTWKFDNVFVDWGDGSQERLTLTLAGDAGDYARGATLNLDASAIQYVHSYAWPGQYIVRVFQLAEDDVQGGAQQLAALAVDAGKTPMSGLNPLAALQAGGGQTAQAQVQYGEAVAGRAYMVFCQPLTIQHRTDPDANGPLKLVDISVKGVEGPGAVAGAGPANPDLQAQSPTGKLSKVQTGPSGPSGALVGKTQPAKTPPMTSATAGKTPLPTGQGGIAVTAGLDEKLPNLKDFQALTIHDGVPVYSTCDYQMSPYARLRYTGQGQVRTRWYVDGLPLPADAPRPVGPSQSRPDAVLKTPPATWGPAIVSAVNLTAQSPVGLEQLGSHSLRVEAEVVVDPSQVMGLVKAAQQGDVAAQQMLAGAALQGALPKLGLLGPKVPPKVPGGMPGPGPVMQLMFEQWATEPAAIRLAAAGQFSLPGAADTSALAIASAPTQQKTPPQWAVSPEQPYRVVGGDPNQPCTFDFPVNGGAFKVVGLQGPDGKPRVSRAGDRYSGQGRLVVPIPGGGTQQTPLAIQGWRVAGDGVTVTEGRFDLLSPNLPELALPALKGRFTRLDGVAGQEVHAWLDATLAHAALLDVQSQPIRWKGVKAPLTPGGDWYAQGLTMPEFLVYDSGFRLRPGGQGVTIDLSAQQGGAPGPMCGGAGADWRGVALGSSRLFFFNFDLPGPAPEATVSDWGIDAAGLCGQATSGPQSHDWLRGRIGWQGVQAEAKDGLFKAVYDALWVEVPWLDAKLTGSGDPVLLAGQGAGGLQLDLKGGPKTLTHGPIRLTAKNLAFVKTPLGAGPNPPALPAVRGDTCFDFQGAGQAFAQDVCIGDLYFAFDGRAYFAAGTGTTRNVGLAGKSGKLAQGTVSLKEVTIRASGGADERLGFDFLADLKLSQALPAATVPVSYRIREPATGQYSGNGPVTGGFQVAFDSPLVKAKIKPQYSGPVDGGGVAGLPVQLALADGSAGSDAPFQMALAGGDGIVFKGEVDLTQFETPVPLKGVFLLGYHGESDFWATKFSASLPGGVVLVPGVLNLYEFGGGLGYHVTRDSLVGSSLDHVEFSPDSTPVLNAMALVGSGFDDGFTFAARGDLNIKPSGGDAGVDMTYTAWLLTSNHAGEGPIAGTLGYGGGAFYGSMGGQWGPPGLEDYVYVQANPGAIGFSIGNGDWYFRAGSQDNPINGHVLILDQGAWLNLSKTGGYHVGVKANARFPNISCDGTCAYVEGWLYADAGIQFPPQLSVQGGGGVQAKGCYKGECVGFGTSVNLYGAAPNPLKLGFGLSVDLPCPAPDVDFNVALLPSVGFGWDVDSCLW